MSKIALSGNASGTGTLTIAAPDTSTDRTLTLPDAGGEVVTNSATQTLTNKTLDGGALSNTTAIGANWSFFQSGSDLVFRYDGTAVFKISSSGAVVAKDNVTAYGTV